MRGKAGLGEPQYLFQRITPAHAGKRHQSTKAVTQGTDHPRACGEKKAPAQGALEKDGSPPRMRGKVPSLCICADMARITPAHAGKRRESGGGSEWRADHPRACGEKFYNPLDGEDEVGSPPRMRGKATHKHTPDKPRRITPAHAGKRHPRGCCIHREADHPRACGEKCEPSVRQ